MSANKKFPRGIAAPQSAAGAVPAVGGGDRESLLLGMDDELHIAWAGLVSQQGAPSPLLVESADCHCLLFVMRGALDAELDGLPLCVPAHQTLLIWPGERCASRMTEEAHLLAGWMFFQVRSKSSPADPRGVCVPRLAQVRNPERMAELFRLLIEEFHEYRAARTDGVFYYHPGASLLLLSLFARLDPAGPGEPAACTCLTALVERARDFIRFNSDKPITAADVAREVQCSKGYLRTAFRKTIGQSATEEILAVRLYNARGFLVATRLSIGQVAEKSGFSSLNYFTRVFTRAHGMTPSAYRAANSHLYTTPGI